MGGQPHLEKPPPPREEQSKNIEPATLDPPGLPSSASLPPGRQPDVVASRQSAHAAQDNESAPRRPRRFLAQPIETSSRSSQAHPRAPADSTEKPGDELNRLAKQPAKDSQPGRRFLPEPIETTTASNRGASAGAKAPEQNVKPGPRRFKPDLIEIDRRSVKGKTKTVDLPLRHNAGAAPADGSSSRPEGSHVASGSNTHRTPSSEPTESRFSYGSLLRRQEGRRHSFRVPDLPSIPSNSSEDSDESCKSPSLSPLRKLTQPISASRRSANSFRESCDGEFQEYLRSLAARSARKQLKEQALAAFPNEQVYETVDHFAIDEDGMDSAEEDSMYPQAHHIKSRRQSSADLSWELEYMRQHKEEAEMRLRAMAASRNADMPSSQEPATKSKLASPPMLGEDIVLPQSSSPEGTMCETIDVGDDAQTASDPCSGCGGLWCAVSRPGDGQGAGLWMGTCRKGDGRERESQPLTGIMTPMPRGEEAERDPFSKSFRVQGESASIAGQTAAFADYSPKTIEDEFHDGFVTQIYNYLSLGYPCVARYYDYELSKISGIPIEELRRDDQHTDAKGYVVAPEGDLAVACMRWKALRLYIREWARQQPTMAKDETGLEAWGMPERRGSWAV